jgi:hypothetical protein
MSVLVKKLLGICLEALKGRRSVWILRGVVMGELLARHAANASSSSTVHRSIRERIGMSTGEFA